MRNHCKGLEGPVPWKSSELQIFIYPLVLLATTSFPMCSTTASPQARGAAAATANISIAAALTASEIRSFSGKVS